MASLLLLFSKNDFKCVMNRQRDNSLISQCLWETLMDYKGNMFVILIVHEFPSRYSISCPSHLIPSHNLFWCFHQVYKIKSIIVLVCKPQSVSGLPQQPCALSSFTVLNPGKFGILVGVPGRTDESQSTLQALLLCPNEGIIHSIQKGVTLGLRKQMELPLTVWVIDWLP